MSTNQIDFKVKNGLVVVTTATIQSTLSSNSTNTGALIVAGGVGVGGGGYFGGVVTATNFILNGYQVSTGTTAASGTGTTTTFVISNLTPTSSTATGALQVYGGVGIGGGLFVGGIVTATNFLLNGYQVSTSTTVNVGSVVVQSTASSAVFYPVFVSTSTTSTTALSEYTTNSFSIIPSTGAVNIASTTSATSTTTGALTVTGGVGIGGSVYAGNIYSNGSQVLPSTITEFTATAGQTLFTVPAGYAVGTVQVFANGIQLGSADYTASNGSTITLLTARNSGDIIRVVAGISTTVVTQDPIVVNDISNQFDNVSNVFALRQDQSLINSIVDSKDLEVVIDGQRLAPYVDEYRYPWITPYDSYKGFRVRGAYLTIYNAPAVGSSAVVVVQATSKARQKRKYPYSASSIAFGD